jgi:hypothetical protein
VRRYVKRVDACQKALDKAYRGVMSGVRQVHGIEEGGMAEDERGGRGGGMC